MKQELRQEFGRGIFYRSGHLNRKLLAQIAFGDEHKTMRLNKIVHPRMVAKVIDQIEAARESKKHSIVVIDAALIYEVNLEKLFDVIIVVSSRMSNRISRVKERDGLSEEEIRDRISKQIPVEEKVKWADITIQNNTSLAKLEEKSIQVFRKLTNLSRKKTQPPRSRRRPNKR